MAFKNNEAIDLRGILFLMLLTLPSIATTNLDCHGKAFHCVNSTHFMICVDLGSGISTTIDDFIIPCPATTVCRSTNRFECEFLAPTVLPIDRSTIATIQPSESDVVTFDSLVTTSVPYEEYFNTVSSTTLSQSDLQSSTTESFLPVHSVGSNASIPETIIKNESISKDANVQPGTTGGNSPKISIKSSDIISRNVQNNDISNLSEISYETTTANNVHEVTTTIDIETQALTAVFDLPAMNTIYNNSQNETSTAIVSEITEPTISTTELFTDFREPLINLTIPELFSIAPETIMTPEPIAVVKEILNITKSGTNNVIVDEPGGLSNTSTHSNLISTTSGNHTPLRNPSIFSSLENNHTITPYEAITGTNQRKFNNTDKLDTHITESFISNTEIPFDIGATETITINDGENVTTPVLISDQYSTLASDYGLKVEPFRDVKEIVNVTKSETIMITDFTVGSTEASKTTDTHVNIFFGNSHNTNAAKFASEINGNVNTTELYINAVTDSTAAPTDTNQTTEPQVNIISSSSLSSNIFNNINAEVTTENTKGVNEIFNATKLETNKKIDSFAGLTNVSVTMEPQVNIYYNEKVNQVNENNTNVGIDGNVTTLYEATTTTNITNNQQLYTTDVIVQQPVTESSSISVGNNLRNKTETDADITTTTMASNTEKALIIDLKNSSTENVTQSDITTNNIIEIATTTLKNDLETLNSSSNLTKELELTTETTIQNNLQNDAEKIGYDLNQLLANTTDRMVLNEKVLLNNIEDSKPSTETNKSDFDNKSETPTISEYTLVQDKYLTTDNPQPSMHEQTIMEVTAVYQDDSATNVNKDSLNKTAHQPENTAQNEPVKLVTSFPMSTFAVNASDRSFIDNSHQLNDSTYKTSINNVSFDYTEQYTATAEVSSTTTRNSVSDSSTLKNNTVQPSPPDQNKLIVISTTEIISLALPTAALDLNKITSTKYTEKPQRNAITTDTFPSLSSTDLKTTEAPYTTPNNIITKKSDSFPDKTISENYEITTRMDLPSQSTQPNDFLTTLESVAVETNSLGKSENKILTNGIDGSTISDHIITENEISAAATLNGESTVSSNIIDQITEGILNNTTKNLTARNFSTEIVYTYTPDTYPGVAAEAIESNMSNMSIDRIVKKTEGSTAPGHVGLSNGNADTVLTTIQKPLPVSTHNVSKEEIKKSQTNISIPLTGYNYNKLNYESEMTSTAVSSQSLDLIKIANGSTSQPEILSSAHIVIEAVTHSMIKDVPVEVDMDQGVKIDKNNTHNNNIMLSTNPLNDVFTEKSTTLGHVLLENSTITEGLRSTLINENIAVTENTLFSYFETDAQTATDTPVRSHTDNVAFKDNQVTTQSLAPDSYLMSETDPTENFKFYTSSESSTAFKNEKNGTSNTHTGLNSQALIDGDSNFARTTLSTINITVQKSSNISLVEDKESNVLNQELSVKPLNESENKNSDLKSQLVITGNKGTIAASTINDILVTGLPNNIETNTINSYETQLQISENVNLGTTKTINNDIRLAGLLHVSENKTNHVPLNSNINNGNYSFGAGPNIQSAISGNKNVGIITPNNNDITITEPLVASLANEVNNILHPQIPRVASHLTETNITNNKQNMTIVATSKHDLIEESRASIPVSTPSSIFIEPITYSMEKPITQADNTLIFVHPDNESQLKLVTKSVEIEMAQTFVSTPQSSDIPSYQSKDRSNYIIQGTTIQSPVGDEKSTTQKSISENLSVTSQENKTQNAATSKPTIVLGVTKSIDLNRFNVANTVNTRTIQTADLITATDKLPFDPTETTGSVIDNKKESLASQASKNRQGSLNTFGDVTSTGPTSIATKITEKDLAKTTEKSPVFSKIMNTDVDVHVKRAVTTRLQTGNEETTAEVNTNKPFTVSMNLSFKMMNLSIDKKSSVDNDSFKDNTKETSTQTLSTSSPSLGEGTESSTGSDVLVDNNMESIKTHSGIISLITQLPSYHDLKERKEKSVNKESELVETSEMPMLVVKDLVTLSVKDLSTPSQKNKMNTREELLVKPESSDLKSKTDIDGVGSSSMKINDTDTKTAASEIKKETPTHELFEINIASTKDNHTSSNKSKDQNKSTFDAHNITVISNDQSGTPHYTSQTKSTAVGDKQTEFPPFESTTLKPKLNKFSCKNKKRGRYADESDCRRFYICLGNSHVVEGTCPNKTVFSEIRKQCTTNLSHCIRNNQFRCVTEGHFSDFLNDNVYYICVRNNVKLSSFIRFKLRCQNGYHLNKTSVRCVLNEQSKESTSNTDSSKNNSDQSASSAKLEEKKDSVKKFKCKKEGIFADRSDCTRYFECTKTDSTGVYRQKRKKCGGDKIFNRDKKRCVDGESDECN